MPYDFFWGDITPALYKKYTNAYERKLQDMDRLNYSLGLYISLGVNNPKKYPDYPFLAEKKTIQHTDNDFRQIAKQRYGKK